MFGGTVIIDDPDNGGSDAGVWRTAIAHTPALRAQCSDSIPVPTPTPEPAGRREAAPLLSAPVPPAPEWRLEGASIRLMLGGEARC